MRSVLDLTPGPGTVADGLLVAEHRVQGVDVAAKLVEVSVRGERMWLPAAAGRYLSVSAPRCLVLFHPQTGRPEAVLGPVNPRAGQVPATMTAAGASTATVTLDGAEFELPFLVGSYGVLPRAVWVTLDDWGTPVLVLGPSAIPDASLPPAETAPPPAASTVQAVVSIPAQWSGSWRSSRGAWDRWNTDRYGGRSTLYQGNGYGSGPMIGLATYGDQLVNLGALSIDRVQVAVRSVGLASGSPAVTLQGSGHGSQPGGAPGVFGDTVSGMGGLVDLSASMREDLRTGASKALALVGADYSAAAGAGNGDGMALIVTYTRTA